jgi:hypothetical protein
MRDRPKHDAAGNNGRQPDDPGNHEDHLNGAQQVPDDHAHRQPPNEPAAARMPFHPAAEKFPLMSKAELAALAEDIKAHGLNEDIETLDEGDGPMVLDGRNRYDACLMAGVTPRFRALSDNTNPHDHLISKNLMRRHSTDLQRALFAARLVTAGHGGDRKSIKTAKCGFDFVTPADAASRIGVSQHAVERAMFILKPDHGTPELIAAIDAGIPWLTLGYAHKIAHGDREDQLLWLDNNKYKFKPAKRAARPPRVPIPWTGNQFKVLTDAQRAVILEKVATPGAIRALSPEKALAIAAKLTARHAPAKDRVDQEPTNEGS